MYLKYLKKTYIIYYSGMRTVIPPPNYHPPKAKKRVANTIYDTFEQRHSTCKGKKGKV